MNLLSRTTPLLRLLWFDSERSATVLNPFSPLQRLVYHTSTGTNCFCFRDWSFACRHKWCFILLLSLCVQGIPCERGTLYSLHHQLTKCDDGQLCHPSLLWIVTACWRWVQCVQGLACERACTKVKAALLPAEWTGMMGSCVTPFHSELSLLAADECSVFEG